MNARSEKEAIYGGKPFRVTSAQGVEGVIIKSTENSFHFRVYGEAGEFVDYKILHDDIAVTIAVDEMASFYSNGEANILDHSPEVLGLKVD